ARNLHTRTCSAHPLGSVPTMSCGSGHSGAGAPMARRAKIQRNRADISRNTGLAVQDDPLDQAVRSELATSGNNEAGIADQRKTARPSRSENNKTGWPRTQRVKCLGSSVVIAGIPGRGGLGDGSLGGDRRREAAPIRVTSRALEDRVGECGDVRVDPSQVAHDAQKVSAVDAGGNDRVRSLCAALQRADVHIRCLRLQTAQQPLSHDQQSRLAQRGIAAQKHRQPEPQALDQFGVHRGDRVELRGNETAAAPRPPRCELQEIVCDDIGGVFEVDHRRQDLLAPRALVLVIERLLVADVGEVPADRGTEPIHDALAARDVGRAVAVARTEYFDRPEQHALEHIGHAQRLAFASATLALSSAVGSRWMGFPGSTGRGGSGRKRMRSAARRSMKGRNSTASARLKAVWKLTTRRAGADSMCASSPAISARNGRTTRQPTPRTSKLPSGRRRAIPEPASKSGGSVPPRLAPSTRASAAAGAITPEAAMEAINRTTATLEWHAQVSAPAINTANTGSPVSASRTVRKTGAVSTGARVWPSAPRARSISPRPMPTRPRFLTCPSADERNRTTPISTSSGATAAMSKARIWVIRVLPRLAPSMTASAGARSSAPRAVNEVAISPVAVLLCSTAVTASPTSTARRRTPLPGRAKCR